MDGKLMLTIMPIYNLVIIFKLF